MCPELFKCPGFDSPILHYHLTKSVLLLSPLQAEKLGFRGVKKIDIWGAGSNASIESRALGPGACTPDGRGWLCSGAMTELRIFKSTGKLVGK